MSTNLDRFLKPRSLALVGATERSVWTRAALHNLDQLKFAGRVHLVNRNGDAVLGRAAVSNIGAIGEPVDLALLMIPAEHTLTAFEELKAAGIGNAIVLSSGFAESGEAGAAAQRRLTEAAHTHGIALLGPNCLGFVNFAANAPVWTIPVRAPVLPGNIAVVSQSGATAGLVSLFAQGAGIGLSYLVSTGNEAGLDVAGIVDYLVDDADTRVIAVFIESVRDPERFRRAAQRASAAGKPVVVLKVGASEATARAAQAHTGSLVGDDRVFDAVCHSLNLARVHSIEELILTSAVLAKTGALRGGRIGFASMSGGICEIAADRAAAEGIALPPLGEQTTHALQALLPGYGTPQNPLDVTGAAMLQPELYEQAVTTLASDPGIDVVVAAYDVPTREGDDGKLARLILAGLSRALDGCGKPSLLFSHYVRPVTDLSREILAASPLPYVPGGVRLGLAALAAAARWSAGSARASAPERRAAKASRPRTEHATLEYLAAQGVAVVPQTLAATAREAALAAEHAQAAVALKIVSADIAHKTEVGGVALNLRGGDVVKKEFDAMIERVRASRPHARIDGIVVAPMRRGGVELLVGIVRDPQWGLVLALGLGGVFVEALADVSQRLLPVTPADVEAMLGELRGAKMLDGFRGAAAVDRAALARAVVAIGDAALDLGPDLVALEVNPLYANGAQVECLDALALWPDAPA